MSSSGEEQWSESRTLTLIESWGKIFLKLGQTGLHPHHWLQVSHNCHVSILHCRSKLHSLIKKYQVEKNKVCNDPSYVSTWRLFNHFDYFLFKHHNDTPLPPNVVARRVLAPQVTTARGYTPVPAWKFSPSVTTARGDTAVPARELNRKAFPADEAARGVVTVARGDTEVPARELKRKAFPADAAARGEVTTARGVLPPPRFAVRVGVGKVEDDLDSEMWRSSGGKGNTDVKVNRRRRVEKKGRDGRGQLAEAIGRFVEVYERVEEAKRRQLLELEKQRMMFTKDLEIQRIRLLLESQAQFQKLMKSESEIFRKR